MRTAGAVAIAVDRLESRQVDMAAEACRELDARVLRWSGEDATLLAMDARVLVARLKHGERRIPTELHEAMSAGAPGLNLVLLCDEPLVDGRARLSRGRVTLLAPPHSPSSIAAELRGHVEAVPEKDAATRPAGSLLRCREQLRSRWWVARLSCGDGR